MIFLIIVVSWLVTAGLAKPAVQKKLSNHCVWAKHPVGKDINDKMVYRECFDHHHAQACWYSLAGPVLIPFTIGSKIGQIGTGPNRAERARLRQVEDAKHKKKLAQISLETTKIKEEEAGLK